MDEEEATGTPEGGPGTTTPPAEADRPAGKPPRKPPISVRYPEYLEQALDDRVKATGTPRSQILIEALTVYLGLPLVDPIGHTVSHGTPPAPPAQPEYLENIERRLVELEARTVATVPTSDPEVLERLDQLEARLGELAQRLEAPSRTKSTATPRQKPTENPLTFVDSDNSAMVPDLSKGLTGAELSQRFNMNPNSVNGEWGRKKANPPDFHRWSRGRDPEGKAWTRAEDGKYYSLMVSEPPALDTSYTTSSS